jgi:hypothetical protein
MAILGTHIINLVCPVHLNALNVHLTTSHLTAQFAPMTALDQTAVHSVFTARLVSTGLVLKELVYVKSYTIKYHYLIFITSACNPFCINCTDENGNYCL